MGGIRVKSAAGENGRCGYHYIRHAGFYGGCSLAAARPLQTEDMTEMKRDSSIAVRIEVIPCAAQWDRVLGDVLTEDIQTIMGRCTADMVYGCRS